MIFRPSSGQGIQGKTRMFSFARKAVLAGIGAGLVAGFAGPSLAADITDEPLVIRDPAPVVYEEQGSYSGWYIRGDVDYHWSKFRGADYITYGANPGTGSFDHHKLKGAMSAGIGAGYQFDNRFRTDLTLDWLAKSKFRGGTSGWCGASQCTSVDTTSYSALLLLANAYVDLGTWHRITPYVGGGIGGAHVKWDKLDNTICDDPNNPGCSTTTHGGKKGWRFAYSLAAGASYCLTKNLDLDVGYRFTRIEGGKMFGYAGPAGGIGAGPGHDKGLNNHEVRGGLRYTFGEGSGRCEEPQTVVYEPEPIYTK